MLSVITLAMLVLKHATVPPHLHLEQPNPELPLQRFPAVQFAHEATPLRSRFAGVSSFGISGTNAHVVIDAAPVVPDVEPPASLGTLLLVSAATSEALDATAGDVAAALHDAAPDQVAATLAWGRAGQRHRLAAVGSDPTTLRQQLRDPLIVGQAAEQAPRVGVLFTGQGSQVRAMAAESLAGTFCVRSNRRRIRSSMRACAASPGSAASSQSPIRASVRRA